MQQMTKFLLQYDDITTGNAMCCIPSSVSLFMVNNMNMTLFEFDPFGSSLELNDRL